MPSCGRTSASLPALFDGTARLSDRVDHEHRLARSWSTLSDNLAVPSKSAGSDADVLPHDGKGHFPLR